MQLAKAIGFVCLLLFATQLSAQAKRLYVDPACPTPQDEITLIAVGFFVWADTPPTGPTGSTVKLVVIEGSGWPGEPPRSVRTRIGALAAGTYRVELYVRDGPINAPGPEKLATAIDFVVQDQPPACEARYVSSVGQQPLITGIVGTPRGLGVTVTDAHGLPVGGVRVTFERVRAPHEPHASGPLPPGSPDILSATTAISNAQGYASIGFLFNESPGTFQYMASIEYADERPAVYFVITNRLKPITHHVHQVVEYHHPVLNHYFMTANYDEMSKLDRDTSLGWKRTGAVFLTYSTFNPPPPGSSPVCRFYGLPEAGLASHFYSVFPQECEAVKQRFGHAWLLETDNAFTAFVPDALTGACPAETRPLYRAFNNRADVNHRYAVFPEVLHRMPYNTDSGPWVLEGYGPNAVAMCVAE